MSIRDLDLAIHAVLCTWPDPCVPRERLKRQLTRHAYPGQPAHRAEHVVQPCCCTYGCLLCEAKLQEYDFRVRGKRQTWCDQGQSWDHQATGFQIHPACPHHGHLAHHNLIERMWEDPYQYALLRDPYDMDDDERQG